MLNPFPTIDIAYADVQQEESQSIVLNHSEVELSTTFSKSHIDAKVITCHACDGKGHTGEKCWSVVGYPRWHHKYKKLNQKGGHGSSKWKSSKTEHKANNALICTNSDKFDVVFTPQHLQQLLKLLPTANANVPAVKGYDTEDELENCFSGMVTINGSSVHKDTWIIDFGTSDHMTLNLSAMMNVQPAKYGLIIKLPTGDTTKITHIGDVHLKNGLVLKNVLYVP
ncbi:hypothetical protein POM88_017064 [Heracleum sosnowskyi]|uniref:Retrovirus-related Pol polyprotein from transposon TNT 1-94-like beta-barrel domain-containing protein n=1 Tax=Heracleum sosnowskyi TaxID=360622 RepID=A0AAD8IQ49_9APIA|nr:hypothetical protein POM88_017064 [Heracleum sosnowskyi]